MTAHTAELPSDPGTADADPGASGRHAALWYEALGILPPEPPARGPENERHPESSAHPEHLKHPEPPRPENDPVTWASRDGLLVNIVEHTHRSLRGLRSA